MNEKAAQIDLRLQKAFQKGLHLPENTDCSAMEFAKSAGWDSIAHLQLIAAIEEEFDVMVETADMLAMSSYSKAKEMVHKYDPSIS